MPEICHNLPCKITRVFINEELQFGPNRWMQRRHVSNSGGGTTSETEAIGLHSLTVDQSQYPTSNVIGGDERLVISRGKYFFEGFRPALCFDIVVAIGLNQFVCRGWIILGFECFIKFTKPPIRVAGHCSLFMDAVTYFLSLPLWLASLFVLCFLVSALFVIWHHSQ